eukprot:8824216-Pyramimonas_sp.AAC.1
MPTRWGPEFEVKHEAGGAGGAGVSKLVLMLPKRVDDLKIAGRKGHVDRHRPRRDRLRQDDGGLR